MTQCDATGCLSPPMLQVYNLLDDPFEHHNLAYINTTLTASLLTLVQAYNRSAYVDPLIVHAPVEHDCPYVDSDGILTPCDIPLN